MSKILPQKKKIIKPYLSWNCQVRQASNTSHPQWSQRSGSILATCSTSADPAEDRSACSAAAEVPGSVADSGRAMAQLGLEVVMMMMMKMMMIMIMMMILMKQMMMAMTCSDMWWSHALKTTNIYRITSERLVTINRFFKFGQQLKWSSSLKPLHPFLRFLHLMNLSGLQLVQYHRFGFKLPIDYNILC